MNDYEHEALRRIAEAADNGSPWEWEHAYPQRITRIGDVALVAECFENPDMPSRFAEFIATFDPPTVLGLLAEIQRVRGEAEAWERHGQEETFAREKIEAAFCQIADGTYQDHGSYISAREFARRVLGRAAA